MSKLDHDSPKPVTIQISLADLGTPEAEQLISHLHHYLAQSKTTGDAASLAIVKQPTDKDLTEIAIIDGQANINQASSGRRWFKYIDKAIFILAFGYLTSVAAWLTQQNSTSLFEQTAAQPTAVSASSLETDLDYQPTQIEVETPVAAAQPVAPVYLPNYLTNTSVPDASASNSIEANRIALQPPVQPIFVPAPPQVNIIPPQIPPTSVAAQPVVKPVTSPIPSPPPPVVANTPIQTSTQSVEKPVETATIQTNTPQTIAKVDSTNTDPNQTSAAITPTADTEIEIPSSLTGGTLIGMLTLGESSSALFSVNGISHRANVGEQIGNTDWFLEAVEHNYVKVSSQQQSRQISVGEQF